MLALTATATRQVVGDIINQLGMRRPEGFKGSFFRPNLVITAQKKGTGRNLRGDLLGIIRRHREESGIVYCMSRKAVDATAEWLCARGVRAVPYHAGLDDDARARNQNAFARDEAEVVVATVAFGMGIDKSNVRFVIHRDMPKSVEAWYQEIGRAGRDGLTSDCVTMFSWSDVIGYDGFLQSIEEKALRDETRRKTIELFNLLDRGRCRHQALVEHFDEAIETCGSSCDLCRGAGIESLVAVGEARARSSQGASGSEGLENPALFERLRAVRKRLADAEGVPAYIVFSDAVLRQMASQAPRTRSALLTLSGLDR